jgi:hypothetical protein
MKPPSQEFSIKGFMPAWIIGVLAAVILQLIACTPPQSPTSPAVAPEKPKASPEVVLLVQSAERGTADGRDIGLLRFFLANKERLTPQDIDYLANHAAYAVIRDFITAEYYAKSFGKPLELEDRNKL